MIVRFWGIRSMAPIIETSWDIQERIAAVVQRIKSDDIKDTVSRNRFLSSLPDYIYSKFGGNTSCTELRSADKGLILINCGSGLQSFHKSLKRSGERVVDYHIFLTQFSHDCLCGLSDFAPLKDAMCRITFYTPSKDLESVVDSYLSDPFFPSGTDSVSASLYFNTITDKPLNINGFRITSTSVKGNSPKFLYRIEEGEKTLLFAPGFDLTEEPHKKSGVPGSFFKPCSAAVLDSCFSLSQEGSHSSAAGTPYSLVIDFARGIGAKRLLLTHYQSDLKDKDLINLTEAARWYEKQTRKSRKRVLHIEPAREGVSIDL